MVSPRELDVMNFGWPALAFLEKKLGNMTLRVILRGGDPDSEETSLLQNQAAKQTVVCKRKSFRAGTKTMSGKGLDRHLPVQRHVSTQNSVQRCCYKPDHVRSD